MNGDRTKPSGLFMIMRSLWTKQISRRQIMFALEALQNPFKMFFFYFHACP
jgi:hypothetical protein